MKNVSDIKKEKNLNYILPAQKKIGKKEYFGNVAIIIHLHYLDTIDAYVNYIHHIPQEIFLFFTVSDIRVKRILEETVLKQRENCKIIEKENRGRDISALLVACRKEILEYEYICFLHDKKEKKKEHKQETAMWIKGLWENTIGSMEYIVNVLTVFDGNSNLGVLVPPPPMSEHYPMAYANTWGSNFELVEELAEKMALNCDLHKEKSPITLGTVFWARVSALKKLFEIEWKYEDFDEEPLKDDGTISHAIERILAYVAQDAGYDTGWIMTDKYASERLEYITTIMKKAFQRLNESLGIWFISELDTFEDRMFRLMEFVDKYERFYIYGAGNFGERCFKILKQERKIPCAFIESNVDKLKEIHGIPVYSLSEINLDESCGIIVAVREEYRDEIIERITNKNSEFNNVCIFNLE